MPRSVLTYITVLGVSAASLAVAAASPLPHAPLLPAPSHEQQSPEPSPETLEKGKEAAERVCTACHELGPDVTAGRSADAWKKVIEEMKLMGAQATDEEFALITEYLIHEYPAKKAGR